MSVRVQLKWWVPRPSWELLERNVRAKKGTTGLYAGIEAEQIADLWLAIEEADLDTLDFPAGDPPHTQKKNKSDTPLSETEKVEVHAGIHPETKECLSLAADEYDVNQGVLLGYIIREYYETDGWGRSIEAVGSERARSEPKPEPTTRAEKLDCICDRLDTAGTGEILASDVHETIADVAGPTVVDGANGYLSDVLDRLGYIHHPHVDHIYISEGVLSEQYDISPDAPAIDRKPYSTLSKDERIEGIKHYLESIDRGLSISAIHAEVFDGNGSKSYMRNLADEVAASDGFDFRTTPSGKKILRSLGESTGPDLEPEPEEIDGEETDQECREEIESDAADEMDALMQGTPTSDGGVATTDGGTDSW